MRLLVVHALTDIPSGTELIIPYIYILQPLDKPLLFSARQSWLSYRFDFICSCPLCSLSLQERKVSDNNRRLYHKLLKEYLAAVVNHPQLAVLMIKEMLFYLEKESLWHHLGERYYDGYSNCSTHADLINTKRWAVRSKSAWTIAKGAFDYDAKRTGMMAKDPRKDPILEHWDERRSTGPGEFSVPSAAKHAFANGTTYAPIAPTAESLTTADATGGKLSKVKRSVPERKPKPKLLKQPPISPSLPRPRPPALATKRRKILPRRAVMKQKMKTRTIVILVLI
ncbi:hypothetical protein IAR50_006167 [Cryptococcus sp. DSM 104548]